MKLFGFNITKERMDNKLLPNLIWKWMYNKEWIKKQDTNSLLNAYRSWVYVTASRNAASFAATPLRLYVAKPKKNMKLLAPTKKVKQVERDRLFKTYGGMSAVRKAVDIEEVTEHPFLDVVSSVNPFMNKTDLLEISDLHEELTGDAYWYLMPGNIVNKEGKPIPKEIWPLNPANMRIVPSPETFISHYVYRVGGTGYNTRFVRFELDEIIHYKFPNPNDPFYGFAPLSAVADMYNINMNMNKFENALFSNNARQEGFFTSEEDIDDDAFEALKSELLENLQGVNNAGKTMLLDKGVKWEKTGYSPRELGFLQGRKWPKEEIFEAFDTPLGLFDPKANRANAEAAQYVYAQYGISPRHRRFEEKLNEQLMPRYDDKLFVAFDNVVPADKEFKLKEDTELLKANAKLINEVRNERGMESLPQGDVLWDRRGVVPLGSSVVGEMSEEEVEETINDISEKIVAQLSGG